LINTSNDRPLVAVTGPHTRLRTAWWCTRFMLALHGVRAVYLTAHTPFPQEPLHGIVIGGGNDIEPGHYGEEANPERTYDPERDLFEMSMIRRAMQDNIPMLGICRGAQLINVVFRGSLHLDIRHRRRLTPNRNTTRPVKWVDLEGTSRLQEHLGVSRLRVNSLHRQAIDQVGQGLTVIGRDEDGFIQAVEGQFGFLLGVQWHPEYLPYLKSQRKLFGMFANAVRETRRELTFSRREIDASNENASKKETSSGEAE
jgi:putative glutamine amidotransferase